MSWSPIWPNGSVSVRANTVPGQGNTTFIKSTMNVNHFWNDATVGSSYDGNHRFVQMPKSADDVPLGSFMDGVFYLKQASITDTNITGFYANATSTGNPTGIYQFIPTFQTGNVMLPSSSAYVNVGQPIPAHTYGMIYMFTDDDTGNMAKGFFVAGTTKVNCYTELTLTGSASGSTQNIRFGNGSTAAGLIIQAQRNTGLTTGPYQYRIVYWAT
jgi:hypothetical protein